MSEINQLQQNFYHNLFAENKKLDFISSDCQSGRFAVYETTILGTLVSALKITYPGVWYLLGDDCANALARKFIKNTHTMPGTGCLDDWGADFSIFLAKQKHLKHLKYIADYAKFEWFIFLSKMANESSAIAPNDLLNYSENELANVRFQFKASVYLFKSDYNLEEINKYLEQYLSLSESAKADSGGQLSDLILSNKKSYILFSKNNSKFFSNTNIHWLNPEIWIFLFYMYSGELLGNAVKNTEQLSQKFDLVEALSFILANNLLASISLSLKLTKNNK